MTTLELADVEFILGNSNKRFSGVTSTMLQVLPHVSRLGKTVVMGRHHLSAQTTAISFWQAAKLLHQAPVQGRFRLFHARRNDEMIQALLLKYLFRAKIRIVFTSTAQRPKTWLTRWLMRQMDGLLSTCDAAASYMPQPPDQIIPHGINVEAFTAAAQGQAPAPALPGKINIGLFGRVRAQKGVDLLIDAALDLLPRYPKLGVVIIGEVTADQQSFVRQQVQRLEAVNLQDRVQFTGKLPFERLPSYFQRVDLVCALSINEGFGLTVLEGAAAGKPVIATKAGAWPDILQRAEIGWLIEVGDKTALIEALEHWLTHPEEGQRLGDNAAALVAEHYSVEQEANSLVAYYRSVLAR